MTVLEIINTVQRELRLPESTSLDQHAALILVFMNRVQRDFMMEPVVWDECKTYSSFDTVSGTSLYTVTLPDSGEVDKVRHLQIGDNLPLDQYSDDDFREYRRTHTTNGQPLIWRVYSRSGGAITIEASPTPDAVYTVDYELLKKPPRLTSPDETPLLDADTLISGTVWLAKKEQGEDWQADLAVFQSKLGLESENQGEGNWGDVEAI